MIRNDKNKIVLFTRNSSTAHAIYNSISSQYDIETVVLEDQEKVKSLLKRRIRRLGLFATIGQVLFTKLIAKRLISKSKKRCTEIIKENALNFNRIPKEKMRRTASVNSPGVIKFLQETNPDLVVVVSTSIFSKETLSSVNCKFINLHTGITPEYRGNACAYWALANSEPQNVGVTVHFIDEGIDTGGIIHQRNVSITPQDNYATYSALQLSEGLKLLNTAIGEYFDGTISVQKKEGSKSRLWYSPTIWQYLYYRMKKGVK